jgi:protein phosphatase
LLVIEYDSIEYASLTDVGVRRSHNQDAHATLLASDADQWRERGHVFIVADGMGAHAVGDMASDLAVSLIPHTYHKYAAQSGVPALRKAFVEANASIHAKGQQNPEFAGMGTTTTALLLRPEGAWIGHVGDSRAYRIRKGQIEQLSFDHSLVWEMARRQGVDPEGLQGIPPNVIIRSLGPEPLVQVDLEGPHQVEPGDIFLLCSDGLSGQVSDAEIGAIAGSLMPAEACRLLVDLANLRGGPDNVTALIVRVREQPRPETPVAATPRRSWLQRLRWPLPALLLGLGLVAYAAMLTAQGDRPLGITIFVPAAIFILAGVVGLFLSYNQERQHPEEEVPYSRAKVYRQAACAVSPPLVEKALKGLAALEQFFKERNWDADWTELREHQEQGQKLYQEGDLTGAFCAACRCLRPFAEALQRYRTKGEHVPPPWDK